MYLFYLNIGAAYICTEDRFPSSRIQQMISNLRFKFHCDNRIDMTELCQTDYGDNILISHLATVVIFEFQYKGLFLFSIILDNFLGRFKKMYP